MSAPAPPGAPQDARGLEPSAHAPELLLAVWLSPSFPVGAFAYSHGLEWAVESGAVRDEASLRQWLTDLVEHGAGRADAVLLAESWRATRGADIARLLAVNELALALAPSAERRLESAQQGRSFMDAMLAAWSHPALERARLHLTGEIAYPVALGAAAGAHGVACARACENFVLAFVANLTSAAVRLGPIGQTQGQRVLAALSPLVARVAGAAAEAGLDQLGSAAFMSDIAAMKHETQYSRLFRS